MSEPRAMTGRPASPARHPRGGNTGDAGVHRESFPPEERDQVARGLDFLEAELAVAEELVDHPLHQIGASIHVARRLRLERVETGGGSRPARACATTGTSGVSEQQAARGRRQGAGTPHGSTCGGGGERRWMHGGGESERPGHDPVGLAVLAENELLRTRGPRSRSSDRRPAPGGCAPTHRARAGAGAALGGGIEGSRHQRLRHTTALPGAVHVEPQQLDRPRPGDALRGGTVPQLREPGQRPASSQPAVSPSPRDRQLGSLQIGTEVRRQVKRHVFGSVVGLRTSHETCGRRTPPARPASAGTRAPDRDQSLRHEKPARTTKSCRSREACSGSGRRAEVGRVGVARRCC